MSGARHWLPLALAFVAFNAFGQGAPAPEAYERYQNRIDSAKNIGMLGEDAFGDAIDLQTGGFSFSVTDVDLPSTDGLAVRFTRSFEVHNARVEVRLHPLADWRIDAPRISARFAEFDGRIRWLAGNTVNRCSSDAPPPVPL